MIKQGIYQIKNITNNKCYIDKSVNIKNRLKRHIRDLKNNNHIYRNKQLDHLQNSWNEDGEENFIFNILEECNKEQLNEREIYWINYYQSDDPKYGYNKTKGGDGGILTEETKKKISKSLKGIPSKLKGTKKCEEIKKKISETKKGQKHSEETKQKISESKKGQISWNKGIPHTNETKLKISEAKKGQKHSEKTKQKMKQSHIGKKLLEEQKINLYGRNKGFKHSEESKKKMSETKKGKISPMKGKHNINDTEKKIIIEELNKKNQ